MPNDDRSNSWSFCNFISYTLSLVVRNLFHKLAFRHHDTIENFIFILLCDVILSKQHVYSF